MSKHRSIQHTKKISKLYRYKAIWNDGVEIILTAYSKKEAYNYISHTFQEKIDFKIVKIKDKKLKNL